MKQTSKKKHPPKYIGKCSHSEFPYLFDIWIDNSYSLIRYSENGISGLVFGKGLNFVEIVEPKMVYMTATDVWNLGRILIRNTLSDELYSVVGIDTKFDTVLLSNNNWYNMSSLKGYYQDDITVMKQFLKPEGIKIINNKKVPCNV